MKYDMVMIGHISKDILIDHKGERYDLLGGAVVHSAFTAAATGKKIKVYTKLAAEDEKLLDSLQHENIDWECLSSKETTSIKNTYFTADKERREVVLLSQADPFTIDEITESADVFYLAGLFGGEIPDSFIKPLSERGKVAMDAQGVLRCLDDSKDLVFKDWENKEELLPYLTYFKTDAAEAHILTGIEDRHKGLEQLHAWGAKEIMLTHNTEVLIRTQEGIVSSEYTNKSNVGRTGRGDTTFSSYIAWRMDHSALESIQFAAALCSIKMESPKVFDASLEAVFARMKQS
ncbi:MAG: PfkB family carbohydrate kinase [Sphaerochaetaceae bacterium]